MANIFLDLDGTLIDPAPGITRSFIHTLTTLGLKAPAPEDLTWVIGPALIDSFARVGAPDPAAALEVYRAQYSKAGLFEARVYDGISEALRGLSDAGHVLYLATAKPHVYARRITAHFGLDEYLTGQFGPELDGTRNDKGALLAHALGGLGLTADSCVMVGDRHHDYDAARAVAMPSIAVTWGFGNAVERAGAGFVCESPAGLADAVRVATG